MSDETKRLTRRQLELGLLLAENKKRSDIQYYLFDDKNYLIGIKDDAPQDLKDGIDALLGKNKTENSNKPKDFGGIGNDRG